MRTGTIAALAAAGALAACWRADDAWHLASRGTNGAPIFRERNDEGGTAGGPVNADGHARGASAGQARFGDAQSGGESKAAPQRRNARSATGAPHRQ
jgi:hypothetical protein